MITPEQATADGPLMHQWATDLFPLCRSLTGAGVRQTLRYIQERLPTNNKMPGLTIHEVASGTAAFDWTVPDEWTIRAAYIENEKGQRILDFQDNNLHIMGYSEPIDQWMGREDLDKHLYSLPDQPNVIPYVTSYYTRRWGFCLRHDQRTALPEGRYRVVVDSVLAPGHLTYGELILPGDTTEEVLFSTYICHPSMANNELSGPVVALALARRLMEQPRRRLSYRFVFVPETIGSIVYLSRHLARLKERVIAGFVLTCVGDKRCVSFMPSRLGTSLADRVAKHVLAHKAPNHYTYSFLQRGSDERQYCSPGVDLPVVSIMRSKYAEYPEYHTSADDLSFITAEGLAGSLELYLECLAILEANLRHRVMVCCEPQLGKRGLYPTLSLKGSATQVRDMMNLLANADGTMDLIAQSEAAGVYAGRAIEIMRPLVEAGLVRAGDPPEPKAEPGAGP